VVISSSVEIEGELSEAEGFLKAMDVEFRTMASSDKRLAQQKVTEYKEEYKQLSQNFQTAKFNAESQALKGGNTARNKILTANQRIDQSTVTLEQSRMLLAQTENIGNTIITDLENQKETLLDAKTNVKDTKQITVEAKNVLVIMGNRAVIHKICISFTILILFGAIIGVAYYGFVQKKK
jgi:vesicle transport through interaction with t-SNAREs protein 1